ncbi:MAG: hypothetical protein Q9164_001797 [Protoblastenia rupestris]
MERATHEVLSAFIENLKTATEDNLDYLDGYEELPEHDQERVRKALEDGHIADEDWSGDPEMNRNGKNGFRTPASKKKIRDEKKEREAAEMDGSPSPSKPPTKKRGRVKNEDDAEDQHAGPAPKKAKAVRQKIKAEDSQEGPKDDRQNKTKGRKKAAKVKTEDEDVAAADEKPSANGRRKSAKIKAEGADAESEIKADGQPKTNPRMKATRVKPEDRDDETVAVTASKQTGRKPAPKVKAEPDANGAIKDEVSGHDMVTLNKSRRDRASRKAAPKNFKAEVSENDEPSEEDLTNQDEVKVENATAEEIEPTEEEPQPKKGRKKAAKAVPNSKTSVDSKKFIEVKASKATEAELPVRTSERKTRARR